MKYEDTVRGWREKMQDDRNVGVSGKEIDTLMCDYRMHIEKVEDTRLPIKERAYHLSIATKESFILSSKIAELQDAITTAFRGAVESMEASMEEQSEEKND